MTDKEIAKRLIEIGGGTPPNEDFFKDIFNDYESNPTKRDNQGSDSGTGEGEVENPFKDLFG